MPRFAALTLDDGRLPRCGLIQDPAALGRSGFPVFRSALFWYNAAGHHLFLAGLVTPPRVNDKSGRIVVHLPFLSFTLALFAPRLRPFGLLSAPFPVWASLRFAHMLFVFTSAFHSPSLIYARENETPNPLRYEKARVLGELQE